jgi:hypothetical protein
MKARQVPLMFLCTLIVAGCYPSPSPRYTLHDGTDPQLGTRSTIKLETATGACEILKTCTPSSNTVLHYWEPIQDQKTALLVIKAYQEATNQATK